MSSVIQVTSVYYPESDGKPMGETDTHRKEMVRQIDLLGRFFAGQRVYVSGDLLLYYEQGNPKKFVVPDVFVVKDLTPGDRRVYKLWVERRVPNVIIEVTSRKTKQKDTLDKPALYAQLGVKEYFVFDPTRGYLKSQLQGYRLMEDEYEPLDADAKKCLVSEELGLRLRAKETQLLFYRLDTGERLLSSQEALDVEAKARRAEAKARRVEAKARRAEAEARRVAEEARRAAEAEVARLRDELRRRSTP